jgi:RNA polymerase primary sigma factor
LDQWEFEVHENAISKPDQEVAFDQAEMTRIISEAIAELPERQADVIRMRFGIGRDDEMTLEEIGQIYGVTRERIRQIEAKSLRYLAHPGRIRDLKLRLGM